MLSEPEASGNTLFFSNIQSYTPDDHSRPFGIKTATFDMAEGNEAAECMSRSCVSHKIACLTSVATVSSRTG